MLSKHTEISRYAIKLEDSKQPRYWPIYSLGLMELKLLKTYIETNLPNGFIQLLTSPAGAPILFIGKRNGSLWLYVNYSGLNNLTIKNRYPLPLIGKFLNRLRQAKYFTQLDLTSVYYWLRIKKRNKCKTAFKTRYGHFKYQVMPFKLSIAPASFQDYIDKILVKKLNIFIIVYLDDILIYTKDASQAHVDAVCWVLNKLRK